MTDPDDPTPPEHPLRVALRQLRRGGCTVIAIVVHPDNAEKAGAFALEHGLALELDPDRPRYGASLRWEGEAPDLGEPFSDEPWRG